jgi:hypothetical protein
MPFLEEILVNYKVSIKFGHGYWIMTKSNKGKTQLNSMLSFPENFKN